MTPEILTPVCKKNPKSRKANNDPHDTPSLTKFEVLVNLILNAYNIPKIPLVVIPRVNNLR